MCRLQFYRNMQKKSTNPSIRTLVSFLQCRLLRVFRILPYAHPGNYVPAFFIYLCHTCLIVHGAEMLEKISFFSFRKDDVLVCHICYVCKVCYCGQFVT